MPLLALAGLIVNVAVLLWLSRRLLGVPVGWGRTVLVSVVLASLPQILSEQIAQLGELAPLEAFAVTTLALGWAITGQLVVLTALEVVIPTRSVPALSVFVREIPARWRRFRRLVAVWWILTKNGLASFLRSSAQVQDASRLGRSVRKALTEGGPTFVKLGQMVATRADLVPDSLVKELSTLHSEVPAEPWSAIDEVITAELPAPADEIFADFNQSPLAAASVAQVHAATLADGSAVVVKVQRPAARVQAMADLDLIRVLARQLEDRTSWARRMGVTRLADGFAASLTEELDYRVEAANMAAIARADDAVRVPHVYREFSTDRLLVMERIVGQPLSRASTEIAALPPEQRTELSRRLFTAVLRQVLVTGTFHADLHPGNIILTADGLALLDFGSVGRLDKASRQSLGLLLHAVESEDAANATDALISLLDRPQDLDDRALQREVGQLILRFGGGTDSTTTLFPQLMSLVVRHGFSIPAQLAAAFRALGALEGSLRLLDSEVNLVTLAREVADEIVTAHTEPEAVKQTLTEQLVTLVPQLQRLPRQVAQITEQVADGALTVGVRGLSTLATDRYVRPLMQQLTLSVLAAALGLAGVALLAIPGPTLLPTLTVWAYGGLWLLLVAFVLGTRVLTTIFHADHD